MRVAGVIEVYSWDVSQEELMRVVKPPEGLQSIAIPLSIVAGNPNHVQILWLEDSANLKKSGFAVSNKMDNAIDIPVLA